MVYICCHITIDSASNLHFVVSVIKNRMMYMLSLPKKKVFCSSNYYYYYFAHQL